MILDNLSGDNMNLYLLKQSVNNDWDTYDSVVVAAETEDEAQKIHPSVYNDDLDWYKSINDDYSSWAFKLEDVEVIFLGVAKEGTESGVILASFNAG
jgi:asparagine synthetase A